MATHSRTLALKIPWMEELGTGYYPWGHKESGMTERMHFTTHKIYHVKHLQLYSSTVLNTFTVLCKHLQCMLPEFFHLIKPKLYPH